jgi:hypothetical protein
MVVLPTPTSSAATSILTAFAEARFVFVHGSSFMCASIRRTISVCVVTSAFTDKLPLDQDLWRSKRHLEDYDFKWTMRKHTKSP